MNFTQINLRKAKLAAIELHNKIQGSEDIVLITEPYLYRNRVVGLQDTLQFCQLWRRMMRSEIK